MNFLRITFLFFFLISFSSFAQESESIPIVNQTAGPYEGLEQFRKNFMEKLNLDKNQDDLNLEILLKFVVDKDGSFTDIEVSLNNPIIVGQVKLALESMPKWKPAIQNGELVRSRFNLPLKFELVDHAVDFNEPLENKIQETSFFKFSCECELMNQKINEFDAKYEFEYRGNIGKYVVEVIKSDENLFQEIQSFYKDYLDSKKIKAQYINYLDVNSFSFTDVLSENSDDFYTQNRIFYKEGMIYILFYVSGDLTDSETKFKELLESFQLKRN